MAVMTSMGLRARAYAVLRAAVKRGEVVPATTLQCDDCGDPAECYDHRDYTQPLVIDPVCIRCNSARGAGLPSPSGAPVEVSWCKVSDVVDTIVYGFIRLLQPWEMKK